MASPTRVVLLILALSGITLLWTLRRNGSFAMVEKQLVTPLALPAEARSEPTMSFSIDDIKESPINLRGREKMVAQLIEAGLPIQPNVQRVTQELFANQSLEELVLGLGDPWAAGVFSFSGATMRWSEVGSLKHYLPKNLRVIRLIEEGRKDPQNVGSLVAADLRRRIAEFPETFLAFEEARLRTPDKTLGIAVAHDGETIGSEEFRKYEEDRYAISAAMWILVNIDFKKGIDAIADFGSLVQDDTQLKYSDEVKSVAEEWNSPKNLREMVKRGLCADMAVYAMAVLLHDDASEEFEMERGHLKTALKGIDVSGTRLPTIS